MSDEERAYEEFCQRLQDEHYAAEQAAMEERTEKEYRLSLVSSIDDARLRELVKADAEGRVFVQPLQIGEECYERYMECDTPYKEENCTDHEGSCGKCHHRHPVGLRRSFRLTDTLLWGKEIFLTKAEAEIALAAADAGKGE